MTPKNRLSSPPARRGSRIKAPEALPDFDAMHPVWDFEHSISPYRLQNCTAEDRAAFVLGMEKRSGLSWRQIKSLKRGQLGFELLPVAQIRVTLPVRVVTPDVDKVMVFRCGGLRRLIGVRFQQIFIVLVFDATGACTTTAPKRTPCAAGS